jgi:hypothetical protein
VATDSNQDKRQRNTYRFDLDEAKASIQQFNQSPAFCATDVLLDRHFKDRVTALDPQMIVERVVLLDGLYATKVYVERGAQDGIANRLAKASARLITEFQSLDEGALEHRPQDVVRASRDALSVILKGADDEKVRQNYSFATKFFHWVTRHHFPIMDSNARKAARGIQERAYGSLARADVVGQYPQAPYDDDYCRWIYFCSDLISGMPDVDREALCRTDYDSQHPSYRMSHSLLRILDKVLYQIGIRMTITNAPALPPRP